MSNTCATTGMNKLNAILIDNRRQIEITDAQVGTMDTQVGTGNRHVGTRDRQVGSKESQVGIRDIVVTGTDK